MHWFSLPIWSICHVCLKYPFSGTSFLAKETNSFETTENVYTRYYSDVLEQPQNTYLNVDQYEGEVPSYYGKEESRGNISAVQTDVHLNFIKELEKSLIGKETNINASVMQNSPKDSGPLIPALRPPPPNLKKTISPPLKPDSVGHETSETWATAGIESSRQESTNSSWTYPSQSTFNSQNVWTQPQLGSSNAEVSKKHEINLSDKVLRTKIIDINTSSDLFQTGAESLSAKIGQMWLDKNEIPSSTHFPDNVDMYTSILSQSQSLARANSSSDTECKTVRKKKSNVGSGYNFQRSSLRSNVDSKCPTISQAFFKNINGVKDSSYHSGLEKINRILPANEMSHSFPNLSSTSGLSPNITNIKQTHSPLVGLSGELREKKLDKLLMEMPDAGDEERLTALQYTGWDVPAAVKYIKLDRLLR